MKHYVVAGLALCGVSLGGTETNLNNVTCQGCIAKMWRYPVTEDDEHNRRVAEAKARIAEHEANQVVGRLIVYVSTEAQLAALKATGSPLPRRRVFGITRGTMDAALKAGATVRKNGTLFLDYNDAMPDCELNAMPTDHVLAIGAVIASKIARGTMNAEA